MLKKLGRLRGTLNSIKPAIEIGILFKEPTRLQREFFEKVKHPFLQRTTESYKREHCQENRNITENRRLV